MADMVLASRRNFENDATAGGPTAFGGAIDVVIGVQDDAGLARPEGRGTERCDREEHVGIGIEFKDGPAAPAPAQGRRSVHIPRSVEHRGDFGSSALAWTR